MSGDSCCRPRSFFVASDDQKMRQRDALMPQSMSASQQPGTQLSDLSADSHESQRNSRANSMLALQSQLAQISQSHPASAAQGAISVEVVGEQYLTFSLLDREFALKAEHIQGVERLVDVTPVPNVAPWVRGVINLRGSIASVVDLRSFLDMEQLPYNPRTRLLSVQYNEMVICLVVDAVSEMVSIPPTAITDISVRRAAIPQWAIPYAFGVALIDRRVIVLIDAARLLFSDKMQRYEALPYIFLNVLIIDVFLHTGGLAMNPDRNRGGMTVNGLMQLGLFLSAAIPVIMIAFLGVFASQRIQSSSNNGDSTTFVLVVVACAIVALIGVLTINYFVQREVKNRLLGLVDVFRDYAGGDRTVRAMVNGDDEFAMLSMSDRKSVV